MMDLAKASVADFWDAASCGELAFADENGSLGRSFEERYRLEPYIADFAKFTEGRAKDVLEIGVGMGADHARWAVSRPKRLCGIDLTPRAIEWTRRRFAPIPNGIDIVSELQVADAENLPFPDASFDIVYSWGVMHHSPDTRRAFAEAARVLRPGGVARIMVYHTWSLTGLMLWARYSLKARMPLSMQRVYADHLESPGTKAYTVAEAQELCHAAGFQAAEVRIQLNHGDLLQGAVGQRHRGPLLAIAKAVWPRWLLRKVAPRLGLYLLIEARR